MLKTGPVGFSSFDVAIDVRWWDLAIGAAMYSAIHDAPLVKLSPLSAGSRP